MNIRCNVCKKLSAFTARNSPEPDTYICYVCEQRAVLERSLVVNGWGKLGDLQGPTNMAALRALFRRVRQAATAAENLKCSMTSDMKTAKTLSNPEPSPDTPSPFSS